MCIAVDLFGYIAVTDRVLVLIDTGIGVLWMRIFVDNHGWRHIAKE
jgi:hypothetical protein